MTHLFRMTLATAAVWLSACQPSQAERFGSRQPSLADTLAEDAALRDACFLDGRHGWAVGDRGVILRTDDGGRRWLRQNSPVDSPLASVWFADDQRGWAVGGVTTPYTHSTRAVVLHTADGGYSWAELPAPNLPRLRGVRFFDAQNGVVFGDSNALSPSGVYETRDGGQHWEALHALDRHAWLAGSFPARGQGALVGPAGNVATLNGGTVEPLVASKGELLAHDIRLAGRGVSLAKDGLGCLVGDGGLLLMTKDGGHRWSRPEGAPPQAAPGVFNWRAVARRGDRIWVVGTPGSAVLASEDGGKSWQLQPTGVNAPLHAVRFVDERRGWALGDLGTILATEDGGRSWRVQRRGGARCAALVIAATAEEMPLELIAKLSAAEGYQTAGAALFADSSSDDPAGRAAEQDRFNEALTGCGASRAEVAWRFPLRRSQRDASSLALLALLGQKSTSGEVTVSVREYVAALLAEIRPEVVLIAPCEHRGAAQLMESAALQAAAGESLAAGQKELGMTPWKPKRVLRVLRDQNASFAGLAVGDFDPQLGTSLAQWTLRYQGLGDLTPTVPLEQIGWTALAGGAAPAAGRGDPLAGLIVPRGGEARRPYADPPASGLTALKAGALKQEQFKHLLTSTVGGSQWANRAVQLTGGLDADSGASHLLLLADGYRRLGKPRLAADAAYLLARRYAEHPLAEQPLRWLLTYYGSSETAHAAGQAARQSQRGAPLANITSEVETLDSEEDWNESLPLAEHQQRALKLGDYIEQARPQLFAEPAARFLLAAAARGQDQPDREQYLLAAFARSSTPAAWRRCARTEEWIAQRDRPAPKPSLAVVRAAEKPMLDGKLDEPFWQGAPVATLPASPAAGDASGARVRIAQDDEFLYVAIEAEELPGAAYPNDRGPRPRDADLSGYDRVRLRIDVDRDYCSVYELSVDCRGWTHDACWADGYWGDASWNPRWYVASQSSDGRWRVEAAIPLKELVPEPPAAGDVWAVSLERQAPGRPVRPWTGAAHADGSPDAYGLLLFPVAL
jgi:photosystem II stability/assembly factor-like uncharacterized protein